MSHQQLAQAIAPSSIMRSLSLQPAPPRVLCSLLDAPPEARFSAGKMLT
jgi:hypothetical protein